MDGDEQAVATLVEHQSNCELPADNPEAPHSSLEKISEHLADDDNFESQTNGLRPFEDVSVLTVPDSNLTAATLTERFENTLAQFLNVDTISQPESREAPTASDPITSVFDLLSEETRAYLREHNGDGTSSRPKDAHPSASQPTPEKRVRMRKPLEISEADANAETDDVLTNYMRTMQHFIGRSFRPTGAQKRSTFLNHPEKESPPTFKDKFGYEPLENVARSLDPSVRRWLISLRLPNLPKYLELFEVNEVDRDSLKMMTEAQLRRMGINKYGPLNKMLHSIRVMRNCEPPRMPPPPPLQRSAECEPLTRAMSAPNSARSAESTSKTIHRRPLSARNQSPRSHGVRKERCLLRLLAEAHESPTSARSSKSCKRSALPSARSALSGAELVQKAAKEIERAALKYQSKLDQDAQKKELNERKERQLQEKREKFAADYRRRQIAMRGEAARQYPRADAQRANSAPATPRTPRKKRPEKMHPSNANVLQRAPVETQMAIDAQKPNLMFEDQLSELEFQIQNLVDVHDLKQADSHTLISCIDQLQHKLHAIQSIVAQQKARMPQDQVQEQEDSPKQQQQQHLTPRRAREHLLSAMNTPRVELPGQDMAQADLKFNERDFLGEGSFTQVFRGRYKKREVAVKRLKTPLTTEDKIRLANEVNSLTELKHENISRILGCIVRMKFPLLITELARGGSLSQLLRRTDPLDHCAFFQIAEDVCAGLAYLHVGSPLSPRAHLRLSSHNVLLGPDLRARISDVGLSRLRHECSRAVREAGAARAEWSQLPWMAPEVLAGEDAGPPADIYSLGVLLWEMMMRQTPYEGLTTFQMIERIRDGPALTIPDACPVGLRGLIRRCWQLRRGDRLSVQEALVSVGRLKFPVGWQTVLQSAGLAPAALCDVAFCRRVVAVILDLPIAEDPEPGRLLPPAGPCGVLSSPLTDLDLSPVSRIEELAEKAAKFISQKSEDTMFGSRASPLTAELSARGAVWGRLALS